GTEVAVRPLSLANDHDLSVVAGRLLGRGDPPGRETPQHGCPDYRSSSFRHEDDAALPYWRGLGTGHGNSFAARWTEWRPLNGAGARRALSTCSTASWTKAS